MAEKPYEHREEDMSILREPVMEYQTTSSYSRLYQVSEEEERSIMRAREQYARGEYYTEEEMEKRIAEWLSEE